MLNSQKDFIPLSSHPMKNIIWIVPPHPYLTRAPSQQFHSALATCESGKVELENQQKLSDLEKRLGDKMYSKGIHELRYEKLCTSKS